MISFLSLGSGSKGNATLIYDEEGLFLVDMGLSQERLLNGLSRIGKTINDIDAVFFTHRHSDHVRGHIYLPEGLPIYSGRRTVPFEHKVLPRGESVEIKGFAIKALATSHDAPDSRGYLFSKGEESLAYLTDTGIIPSKTLLSIKNSTYYIIESNHDVDMLRFSSRPQILIERILSSKGHLSNVQCAEYLAKLIGPKTKEIVLAHLSEECNDPNLALAVVRDELMNLGIDLGAMNIVLKAASQWEETVR